MPPLPIYSILFYDTHIHIAPSADKIAEQHILHYVGLFLLPESQLGIPETDI